jgi:hypothetical protein
MIMRNRAAVVASMLVGFVLALGSDSAKAQFAVVDIPHTIETIIGHSAQLAKWADQLQRMQQQYQQLQRTYDTLKNPRAYIRTIANNALHQQVRSYMPADFRSAINARYFGGYGGDPYTNMLTEVVGQYGIPEWWSAFQGVHFFSNAQRLGYDNKLGASQAMMAGSLVAQRNLTTRFAAVNELIESASYADDLKASVDTSARVQAEVAYLMIEALRLQSQNAYLASNDAQRDTAAQARSLQMSRWKDRSW